MMRYKAVTKCMVCKHELTLKTSVSLENADICILCWTKLTNDESQARIDAQVKRLKSVNRNASFILPRRG